MKNLETIAKTKTAEYPVILSIVEGVIALKMTGKMIINGKEFELGVINTHPDIQDRIHITRDICNELGIEYNVNLRMRCNLSAAVLELKKANTEIQNKSFTGEVIDSGFGFKMKNTKKNFILCLRYGYDAIERVS